MVATFVVPRRDPDHANTFIEDLASRLSHRVQLSSDSPPAYAVVVERGFGSEVDESLIVKSFTSTDLAEQRRYSPPELTIRDSLRKGQQQTSSRGTRRCGGARLS
jgi:hypothetical protein